MSQPTVKDVFRALVDERIGALHTALPGIVESYEPGAQRAKVKPAVRRVYRNGRELAMPSIVHVPVVWPRTAAAALILPLAAGDTVLLVFAERSLERWLASGGETAPGDPRQLDLADAVAIPGLYPFSAASPAPDNDAAWLLCGDARLKLSDDGKVALGGSGAEVLDIVKRALDALAVATVSGSPLSNAAEYATLSGELDGIRGTL